MPRALQELKECLEFLQQLWAILAGILVLFPVSNAWQSDDRRRVVGDRVLIVAQVGFFGFVTRAFLALGLRKSSGARLRPAEGWAISRNL